jgi:hypothetical protein
LNLAVSMAQPSGTTTEIVPVSSTTRWNPAGGDDGRAAAGELNTSADVPVATTVATSRTIRRR